MCLEKDSFLPQGSLCCVTHLSCSCGSPDESSLRNKRGAFMVHDLRRCSLSEGWRRKCSGRESGVLVLIGLPTPPLVFRVVCPHPQFIQLNLLGNILTDIPRSVSPDWFQFQTTDKEDHLLQPWYRLCGFTVFLLPLVSPLSPLRYFSCLLCFEQCMWLLH